MQTVNDFIPEYAQNEFNDLLDKKGHLIIKAHLDGRQFMFPSNQFKYVHRWAILEDNSVIGHNESPRNGFSFPIIGKKAIYNFYKKNPHLKKPKELLL